MKPQVQADELNHEIIDVDHGDMGRLVWHTITDGWLLSYFPTTTHEIHTKRAPSQYFTEDDLRDSLHPFWNSSLISQPCKNFCPEGRGGGVLYSTPLYQPYRYVPPHRVWLLRRFGLKTGLDFVHFGLESGMV